MIPDTEVERVRESADIVAVIGDYVELKRMGVDFRGPCPFHQGTSLRNVAGMQNLTSTKLTGGPPGRNPNSATRTFAPAGASRTTGASGPPRACRLPCT